MDVFTMYVGQGALAGIRSSNEGIIVDAHMPEADEVTPEDIQQSLKLYFDKKTVRGLILTGFDRDHAHASGVDWILTQFQPGWVMYPKYYKDTDCATEVFAHIERHEKRRANTANPLVRHSMRLDRLDSREIKGLADNFTFELFSPHTEDMDCSNNCSIVVKITGAGARGFRYLVTGDTETPRLDRMSEIFGDALAADVLAAPHHGALSGCSAAALLNISPNTVLISAGVDSKYDHPDEQALAGYCAVAKHVFSTNANDKALNLLTKRQGSDFETQTFEHATAQAA